MRRAQIHAHSTNTSRDIARYLLNVKIDGQATNARKHLDDQTADLIDTHRARLATAASIADAVKIEAAAAKDYFAAWAEQITITWANKDRDRVPDHWHTFGARRSPLTRTGTRRATNPLNALLNYLYALAEIECRHACVALGLDPGLGYFHEDVPYRDSLALDLIEAIRPDVDAYTLDLAQHHIFNANDFTERDDGHCRILPPLTHHLAATMLD